MFIDAIKYDPNGLAMRQIPIQTGFLNSLWISESGVARRRYYNSFDDSSTWGEKLTPHAEENGNTFLYTGCTKLDISKAIASAWIANPKNRKYPKLRNVSDGSCVSNMYWSESDDDLVLEDEHEEWKDFTNENNIHECDLQISSLGRFRNKLGEINEGTYFGNEKVICLPLSGILKLQEVVDRHFNNGSTRNKCPERIQRLIDFLHNAEIEKDVIDKYAALNKLNTSTVWSYMYDAFIHISINEAKEIAKKIVSDEAYKAMQYIFENNEQEIFSQSAKEYMKYIDKVLCDEPDWKCNPNRFDEVRLLKLLCTKCAIH
jgi:hypothetical protein